MIVDSTEIYEILELKVVASLIGLHKAANVYQEIQIV